MRAAYIVFILFCVVLSIGLGFSGWIFASPEETAGNFLNAIRAGNVQEAVGTMDNNPCNCPPKGGYISYFNYGTGLNPNLTFLIGDDFNYTNPEVKPVEEKTPYMVPWEKPESDDVTVRMTMGEKRPLFLPIPMAFGEKITEDELKEFDRTYYSG